MKGMQEYKDQLESGANPDWRIKEALLYAVGSLNEIIRMHEDMKRSIEHMLQAFVLPDLTSTNAPL